MKQLRALAWKEWHESRAYLFIGLGIFLGLPLIGEIESVFRTTRRFEIDASGWVVAFGGVLAVIVAVSSTCRDVTTRLEDFWRSRPVTVGSWFLVKYAVGLAVVLVSCMLPIAVELCVNRNKEPLHFLVWFPFLWAAIFSIAFLAGCIVRKTAQAATLALAGLLLIYLVPVIIPPLEWLNISQVTYRQWPYTHDLQILDSQEIFFGLGMCGLAIVGLLLSLLAIRRGWHLISGQKTMYGLVAAALLLLMVSAAFQLGTNLPILQQVELPKSESVLRMHYGGRGGYVISIVDRWKHPESSHVNELLRRDYYLRTLGVDGNAIKLGDVVQISDLQEQNLSSYFKWSLDDEVSCRLDVIYPPEVKDVDFDTPRKLQLNLFAASNGQPIQSIHLWDQKNGGEQGIYLHAWNQRLFVIGRELMIFDISDAKNPRLLSDVPSKDLYGTGPLGSIQQMGGTGPIFPHIIFPLPKMPGLPPMERLKLAMENAETSDSFDGTTLCSWMANINRTALVQYHLAGLTETTAAFDEVGEFEPSFLEQTFNFYGANWQSDHLQNGLFYHSDGGRSDVFNSAISIFDTSSQHPMQRIGHFAAPDAYMVQPLPNGLAIAGGGNKLYLIGPPPRH